MFDLPDVIEHVKGFLAKESITESRVTLISGDMLKDIPQSKKVDTIIAKNLFVIFTEDEVMIALKSYREVVAKD